MIDNAYMLKAKRQKVLKKKPKIAVCLYGHLRTYKECAPFLKHNLLSYYDCDLFMHTWSKFDHSTPTWHDYKKVTGDVTEEEIIKTYGEFKNIIIEEQIVENLGVTPNLCEQESTFSIFGVKSAFYSRYKACEITQKYAEKNNITYDYIFFIRPDIWLKTPFLLEEFVKNTQTDIDKTIFTFAHHHPGVALATIDIAFYAKMNTMFKFMDSTEKTIEKLLKYTWPNYNPECSFDQQVTLSGLFFKSLFDFEIEKHWTIKRIKRN